jgi:peptidoglycan/LPS O-acetylase OafA/YrhL
VEEKRTKYIHLDMLRGLAALGVVIGHVRGFLIVPYQPSEAVFNQCFYFITSLGHQCVIAFFALSGFLVGGQVLRELKNGRWSFRNYMLRRLTRLWTVLIPAIVLTWILDTTGTLLKGNEGYQGAYYSLIASGPSPGAPADLSFSTFIANLLFLQTILAPVFGSNGPLWSLANEFWYYIVFPLIFVVFMMPGRSSNYLILASSGLALGFILPIEMMLLGSIWLAGALGHYASGRWSLRLIVGHPSYVAGSLVTVTICVIVSKVHPGLATDLILGAAFANLLPALGFLPHFGTKYYRVADGAAKISYTLYTTHFPLLTFLWLVVLQHAKYQIGVKGLSVMICFVLLALLTGVGMWWFFERNTDYLREKLQILFSSIWTVPAGTSPPP